MKNKELKKLHLDRQIDDFITKCGANWNGLTKREVYNRLHRVFAFLKDENISLKDVVPYSMFEREFGARMSEENMKKSYRYLIQFIRFASSKDATANKRKVAIDETIGVSINHLVIQGELGCRICEAITMMQKGMKDLLSLFTMKCRDSRKRRFGV